MLARIRKAAEEREGGFTLIELLVVIIIIGILAAIAIPVFLNQRQKGYDAQAKSDLRNVATAEETYLTENPASYLATAAPATALLSQGFHQSGNVTAIKVTVDVANGFCAEAKSASGKFWYYDSGLGGVQTGNTAPTGGECATGKAGDPGLT
jgi:type IV pilus assembly protein PilA